MRIIGLMVVGPGEAGRYLEASLRELERLCDDAVIALNNTDPETEAMVRRFGFWSYRDDREWGLAQPLIKTDLLRRIGRLKPDIVIPLDADEVFTPDFDRARLEEMARTNAVAWYFYIVNLWNEPGRYWPAGSFWNIRAFRWRPELGIEFLKRNVHCGLAPPWAYQYGRYAPFHVKHFGLMREEDRLRKVERYRKYDPKGDRVGIGAYYEALAGKGPGAVYDPAALQGKVTAEVERIKQPDKVFKNMAGKTKEFCYVRRLKDGVTLDIPKSDLERTLQTGKFEFVSDVKVDEPAPLSDLKVEGDALECPLCGHVAPSDEALTTHKAQAHEEAPAASQGAEEATEKAPAKKAAKKPAKRKK